MPNQGGGPRGDRRGCAGESILPTKPIERATSMMAAVALVATVATVASLGGREAIIEFGGDPARGVLVNLTPGARPDDPPDPSRPTVVFIHGFNPVPRLVHFTMAERLAEAVRARAGDGLNVLAWDWNAATFESAHPRVNRASTIHQGCLLAAALRGAGVSPGRTHLIGHSAGGIVAASAARALALGCGEGVAQLTFLDPASAYHDVIFRNLAAGSLARRVENYWVPGPSAYGREVRHANVQNTRVPVPSHLFGLLSPVHSGHLYVVRWYVRTVDNPAHPAGFNTSLLLLQEP
jgi:pimeloyl-ACP methyl ester carboxylesterase